MTLSRALTTSRVHHFNYSARSMRWTNHKTNQRKGRHVFSIRILSVLAAVFGGMYVNVGVQHFTDTAWFEPIVPAALGDPTVWVLITGVIEIAIGIGLIIPQTRWYAGWTSAAFLVAVYWANLNMWVNDLPIGGQSYADIWHVLRLVAQIGMIGLSLAIAGASPKVETLEGR